MPLGRLDVLVPPQADDQHRQVGGDNAAAQGIEHEQPWRLELKGGKVEARPEHQQRRRVNGPDGFHAGAAAGRFAAAGVPRLEDE